ncbi:transglutaminase family protein [Georgenia faecalis]|uniref:Transglutaminase N-terminal domain-containing protein n=1 Tax=Georgenia faecalis TaxID=2483799 RepID=A0ABV9D7C4_9MICO|nr:transglutaminase family protein [Georgenia faecalis]
MTPGQRRYRVVHRATSTYPEPVTSSYGRALLLPRDGAGQNVHHSVLHVVPGAADRAEHLDVAGNRATYFHITAPHTVLEVRAESVVSVTRRPLQVERVPQLAWERVAAAVRTMRATGQGPHGEGAAAMLGVVDASLPSAQADPGGGGVLAYALPSFPPGLPLVTVLADLAARLRSDASAPTPPGALALPGLPALPALPAGRGVGAPELAHLMCACLRAMGLAARYVSGYRRPSSGDERTGGQGPRGAPGAAGAAGADATHAWTAVWLPGAGWLHIDPAHEQFADDGYVVLAWGRDARDVSPLRGVVFTPGEGSTLTIDVTLEPVSDASEGTGAPRAGEHR